MKPKIFLALILTSIFITLSCKESITDSRPRIIRPPQDMIWTADTIKGIGTATQLLPQNLLVFSANDAWLTCWSDIARGLIWHFDGKSWNESDIRKDVGGMRVSDIEGYSSSDLWACGYSGDEIFLAHYNGTKWTKYNTNGIKGELLDMCKDTDGNIWASGRNGVIMKYDKAKWNYEIFDKYSGNSYEYFFKSIAFNDSKIQLLLTKINTNPWKETYYYINGNLNNWTLIDSLVIQTPNTVIKWGYRGLVANNSLWSYGIFGVWKLENNIWVKKLSINNAINGLAVVSNNYGIGVGDSRSAFFFNGIGWVNITGIFNIKDPLFVFREVWSNGYETIIAGEGVFDKTEKLIVWRGK